MRIWSIHSSHLDRQGLVACWRETLLAQAVLAERTKGYRNHPQLDRFKAQHSPRGAIATYLDALHAEATARGYRFDRQRVDAVERVGLASMVVTRGQLDYEWSHLGAKLSARSPEDAARWSDADVTPHPLFTVVEGPIEPWERP